MSRDPDDPDDDDLGDEDEDELAYWLRPRTDLGLHLQQQGVTPQQRLILFLFGPTVMVDHDHEREVVGMIDLPDGRYFLTVITAQSVGAILRVTKRAGGWDENATVVIGKIAPRAFTATNGETVVPDHELITTMEGAMRQRS